MARSHSRRSSRTLDAATTVLMHHSRGTRSTTAIEQRMTSSDERSEDEEVNMRRTNTAANKKKRAWSGRSNALHLKTLPSPNEARKKLKHNGIDADTPKEQENPRLCKDDASGKTDNRHGASRKAPPLLERMTVIAEQYKRLAAALIASETRYLDESAARVQSGACEELLTANEPLQRRLDERKRIAKLRLDLQKEQFDREWLAEKTQAHHDFIKKRGDLRSETRTALSKEVFNLSHEHRQLCSDSIGAGLDNDRTVNNRGGRHLLSAPNAATLTEKDEDFLLMDIRPVTRSSEEEDEAVLQAAPILHQFAQASAALARRQSYYKMKSKPATYKTTDTLPGPFSAPFVPRDEQNGVLPGINSFLKKDKVKEKKFPPAPPPKAHHSLFMPNNDHWASSRAPEPSVFKTPFVSPTHTPRQFGDHFAHYRPHQIHRSPQEGMRRPNNFLESSYMPTSANVQQHHFPPPSTPQSPRHLSGSSSDSHQWVPPYARPGPSQYGGHFIDYQRRDRMPGPPPVPLHSPSGPSLSSGIGSSGLHHSLLHPFKRADLISHDYASQQPPHPQNSNGTWNGTH